MMSITFSIAGGFGEEQNGEINYGLNHFYYFLRELHEGRNSYDWQPSFQPFPLLARRTDEQKEKEEANEEIDAQMNNKGMNGYIKSNANDANTMTLNCFIDRRRI
ncbi:MAG: hypothetical protein EZS28_009496 [Streblomastix strix]|uniref:Uncharacterized protein n=1 Tax=Streblomastix strix TaxID=222440 RepID=A0A5J4WKB2_9EUKA|nr:MAG: hypothetical protein EZS28_009496 [Streblomastix strix]